MSPQLSDLATRIDALEPEQRLELLRRALTPEMKFCLLVEELSRKTEGWEPEKVARDIDEAVREVRRARAQSAAA